MPKKKLGFTLAEVLITLAIIGVVAALTIPTVIANYRNHEIEVRLKKAYSILSNAANHSIMENGPIKDWDLSNGGGLSKYLMPYLKIQKDCLTNFVKNNCPYEIAQNLNGGNNHWDHYFPGRHIVLNDGITLNEFCLNANFCWIFTDLNGNKKPNKIGYDVFVFGINRNKNRFELDTSSRGIKDLIDGKTGGGYGCSKEQNGMYCGALIQANGWEIPTKEEYINKFGGTLEKYPW